MKNIDAKIKDKMITDESIEEIKDRPKFKPAPPKPGKAIITDPVV